MADTINILSLCSGVGMLDLGLRAGLDYFGIESRVVGHVERDAYAAAVLMARMEDASLEPAPVWCGNIEDMDARSLRGHVDVVCAGFPCQPWSHAGKQAGTEDERWLWPAIVRVLRDVEPGIVFLENVPGIVSGGGLEYVLSDLAALGFDAEWSNLTAAAVGASHKRERIFILAYRQGKRWEHLQRCAQPVKPGGDKRTNANGQAVADASSERRQQKPGSSPADEGEHAGRTSHGTDELASSESNVAEPVRGGLGELRQPPGSNGQPDGSDGALGNANGQPGDVYGRQRAGLSMPAGPSRVVGDTEHGKAGNGTAGPESGAQGGIGGRVCGPADASGVLGDTESVVRRERQPGLSGARGGNQPETSSVTLGDPASGGAPAGEQPGRLRGVEQTDKPLGQPTKHGLQGRRDEAGSGSIQPGRPGGNALGHSRRGSVRQGIDALHGLAADARLATDDPESSGIGMADAERTGSQGSGPAVAARRRESQPCDTDGGLFAPGPSDPRWSSILRDAPWLAPAISAEEAESLFCRMADGLAGRLDEHRADRLRCIGNGVLPAQAGAAFVELVRRAEGV